MTETQAQYIAKEETCPMWQEAVSNVLERFNDVGYDTQITHTELKDWMGIAAPQRVSEVKKADLDYLSGMERVKDELLLNYNLFLYPVIGVGYRILRPDEQIRKGADYYIRKSQKALVKCGSTLANVDESLLDTESRELQLSKIGRIAFLKAAFRKRRIPMPERKQIA